MKTKNLAAAIGKWGGRLTALLLVLFWGAFFLEHLSEWFLRGGGQYPPPKVWAAQAFHLGMIVGLLMMLKWSRLGSIVLIAATVAFFYTIAWFHMMPLSLINLVPVAFFTLYWVARKS